MTSRGDEKFFPAKSHFQYKCMTSRGDEKFFPAKSHFQFTFF